MTKHHLSWDNQPDGAPLPGSAELDLFAQLYNLVREERCYLDPKLHTQHLCLLLQTTPKALLKALKNNNFRNFSHFINHYRIEEAKKMMAQEAFDIYTLEAIAEKSGFGTRQAFYNSFERMVGMKPACYRRGLQRQRRTPEK